MADTNAEADIRGLDIQKLAVGFAEEEIILKKYVINATTSAREIRWYQKTAGFLDSPDTTGITASHIANTAFKARPVVVEQSWTRQTSYVRKYFVESPLLSEEDIQDSDVDILATNVRDLTRAVAHQVDLRIYSVLTENDTPSTINTNATNAAWNAASYTGVNIIEDLMEAKMNIRNYGYNPEGAVLLLSPLDHKSLITWLIDGKGSSIPQFSSQRVEDGVVMEILGLKVVVSTIVTADKAVVFVPNLAAKWKSFMPITTAVIEDKGIGRKIRIWEEGERSYLNTPAGRKSHNQYSSINNNFNFLYSQDIVEDIS
jgi:hypothetical protein